MVRINGQETACAEKTVREYLENAGYDARRVAVELNGEILPKSEYDIILKDGDNAEVVSFVGGG